ncbi:amidohydrolase family protein [Hyphomicrobium sp.]|uniref:amidohydrolase n=1 Tax=Hyphomicrobium sp. TaxID=82 RepID=UPI001D822008|nr:amidohydrolase family protein [Hyphomicrobium sp.]MBY0558819.1 amidohydrolase family protein [Hyphomicrobium sp.]
MATEADYADLIVVGGRAITMHDNDRDAHGLAIRGDRIIRVLRRDEIDQFRGPDTNIYDLGDRPIMPGFVDVHAHSEVIFRTDYQTIDCRLPECSSVGDICDALTTGAKASDYWIVGQGNLFFDRKLKEGRLPTREELDKVSRDRPVALRAGGHITVLNSKALEVSGIDRNYVPPDYSVTGLPVVERNASGDPTGVVKEMDALLSFPQVDKSELRSVLKNGVAKYFTRFGVTTIGEISETIDGVETLNALAASDELDASYRIYIWAPGTLKLEQAADWKSHINLNANDAAIRIQGIKLFSDGGFSAKSAAVTCPYVGSDGCGQIAFSKYFFRRAFELSQASNLQLSVHANGDRAQEWLCECIVELGGTSSGRTRTRVEHAGNWLPRARTMDSWARAGIIPVPQPVFIFAFGEYFPDYLGEIGSKGRFPFKTLLSQGWRLNGSSDVWVGGERETTNPFHSIWCCLKRQAYSGAIIDLHEAITLDQALRMHTIDSAAALGEEDTKGSLAPGKLADVIALDRDPYRGSVDEIRDVKVEFVLSRGRVVLDHISRGV